ncbi:hypothetical protein ACT4UM_11800, partial [Bacillus sp. SS-TM]
SAPVRAEVQLEIWKDGVEKHEFIPAKEGNKGEYETKHTFKSLVVLQHQLGLLLFVLNELSL